MQVHDVTESLHAVDLKRVSTKEVVPAIASLDNLFREYTDITGYAVDENLKVLRLRRIVPEAIKHQMQTVDINTYQQNKDYATRQARTARNEKAATDSTPTLDAATKPEGGANTRPLSPPWTQEEDEQWMMSMKGGGGKGKKGGKGGLCYNCGEPGHFARGCP